MQRHSPHSPAGLKAQWTNSYFVRADILFSGSDRALTVALPSLLAECTLEAVRCLCVFWVSLNSGGSWLSNGVVFGHYSCACATRVILPVTAAKCGREAGRI